MSLYRSEVSATNTTGNPIVIGTVTIPANNGVVTFWKTTDAGFTPTIFNIYQQFNSNQSTLNSLVQTGSIQITQDSLQLTYEQHVFTMTNMAAMVAGAATLDQLLIPVKNQPTDDNGTPLVTNIPKVGDPIQVCTHNYADPCTWFGDSVRVASETLTDSGDGLTFNSAHVNWIDMVSGRVHQDYTWAQAQQMSNPGNPHGYMISLTSNGVAMTMRTPFALSGGDYEVNWDTGQIIFYVSQSGKTVVASYSYATTSTFYLQPFPWSTALTVEASEMNTTLDIVFTDAMTIGLYVYNPATNSWICEFLDYYKRVSQMFQTTRGAYPVLQALGASASDLLLPLAEFRRKSRGLKNNMQEMPFLQQCAWNLVPGAQMRIKLQNDIVLVGEHSSMTFFCTQVP